MCFLAILYKSIDRYYFTAGDTFFFIFNENLNKMPKLKAVINDQKHIPYMLQISVCKYISVYANI